MIYKIIQIRLSSVENYGFADIHEYKYIIYQINTTCLPLRAKIKFIIYILQNIILLDLEIKCNVSYL